MYMFVIPVVNNATQYEEINLGKLVLEEVL
jgi:hypothetical protein